MLKFTHHKKKLHYRKKLYHINLVSNSDQSVRCNRCGYVIAPFNAFKAYLSIDIAEYRFGNHFLIGGPYQFQSLVINNEGELFDTQEPFQLMQLKTVQCKECQQVLGLFFETYNIYDTEWLLDSVALNMQKLKLGEKSSNMDRVIQSLFKLLTSVEIEKQDHPVAFRLMKKKEEEKQVKKKAIESEKELQRNILLNTNPHLPENKAKGALVEKIIKNLAFFDRMTERLEQQSKRTLEKSELLKHQILNRCEELLNFKSKILKQTDRDQEE